MPASGLPGCKKDDGRPRQRGELSRASPAASREADTIMAALRTHRYRAYFSLSDSSFVFPLLGRKNHWLHLCYRWLLRARCAQFWRKSARNSAQLF